MEWLKSHWYWALGAVIGIWVVMRILGRSTVAANVTTPTGTQLIYGGTNANDAAVQVAQLQEQRDLAAANIAMTQAVQLATIAEHASESAGATDLEKTRVQSRFALDITNSNNALAASQSQMAYSLGLDTNNKNLVLGLDANAKTLAALENTNATKLAAYGIQATVANTQTNALRDILVTSSNNSAKVTQQALTAQRDLAAQRLTQQQAQYTQLVTSKTFDLKSQHGGANSVAALAAVLSPATAAASASSASYADIGIDAPQGAAIIQAIGNATKGALTALFAA